MLTLTGARLSEVLYLKWDEIGELTGDGASARLEDTKTGPWTESAARVFPEELTSDRLYTFWVGVREEAGLPGLRIHDCRHTWISQGVMNGVGITTVGLLPGHRQRETAAIYAHLGDGALRDAAAQAATVIARAMGYRTEPPPLPDEVDDVNDAEDGRELGRSNPAHEHAMPADPPGRLDCTDQESGAVEPPAKSGSVAKV